MIYTETKIRVLYAYTDKMNIVSNTRYLEFYEAGRMEMLRQIGYPYNEMEEDGIGLPLIESHSNYLNPARFDDIIRIRAFLKEKPTVRIKIDYELYVGELLINTGYTLHSFVRLDILKPVRPPQRLLTVIKDFENKIKSEGNI